MRILAREINLAPALAEARALAQLVRDISGISTTDDAVNAALQLPAGKAASRVAASIDAAINTEVPTLIAEQIADANPAISAAAAAFALDGEGILLKNAPGVPSLLGYTGRLFVVNGTSITAGFQANIGDVPTRGFVHKAIVRDLGGTLDNQAVDSSGIVWNGTRALSLGATRAELTAAGFDPDQSYETKVLGKNADLYVFDHGYNDRNVGTIGSVNDTTPATFYGAYNRILGALLAEKPSAQIALVTPPSLWAPVNGGYNASTAAIRTAILALGEKYAIPVLDMATRAQINQAQAATFLPDDVHPSVEAHERMSRLLGAFIRDILPISSTTAAPDSGMPGLVHRWSAATIVQNDGAQIQNWQPNNGAAVLTQGDPTKQPTLRIENGVQMLRFDGVNDEMTPHIGMVPDYLHTVTVVTRVRPLTATGQGIINLGTGAIQRGTASNEITDMLVALGGGTGASNTAVAVNPSGPQFHVITMALGPDQDSNTVRQVTVDGVSAAVNGDASPSTIRPGFGIGIYGSVDILDIRTSEFALTTSERADVYEAARAEFPGLIA